MDLLLAGSSLEAGRRVGLRLPEESIWDEGLLRMRRVEYDTEPGYASWGLWVIGLRSTGEAIGGMGFHTVPDAEYLQSWGGRGIEFGYGVVPEFRRRGYATEAVRGLLCWAVAERGITRFLLSICPGNTPSQALARRLGYVRIGQHQDEIDGLEDVLVLEGDALWRTVGEAAPGAPMA